jgi:hypothetical protein
MSSTMRTRMIAASYIAMAILEVVGIWLLLEGTR